jgi:cation diffusion facilitator family transporter
LAGGSKKVIILALFANLGIAIAKFVAYAFTMSASMMAEAIHSVADTGNQVLLLFGMKRAAKPPDEAHPFGYKRESYFWSFIVAIMLFSLGGLFALYEGMHKLSELNAKVDAGESVKMANASIAIIVLSVSIALEGYSWFAAVKEVNRLRGDVGMFAFIKESKSTEIIVILLEDTGALIGLVLALGGVLLAMVTGDPYWDVYGTFGIGILLIVIAFLVGRETKSLLIGEAATVESQNTIRELVTATEGVVTLVHLRSMQLGEDEFLAAIKLQWKADLTARDIAQRTNELEARIRDAIPRARYLFVETDIYDPDYEAKDFVDPDEVEAAEHAAEAAAEAVEGAAEDEAE